MKTFIVDSFTDAPFKGNPAGVCIVESQLSEEIMLHVAQELNLSETAFIRPLGTSNTFSIRYFSPKMEILLCGHATLASAKVVFATNELNEVHFINTQNLDLSAKESEGQIVMEFPIYETQPSDAPPALLAALGIIAVKNAVYNEETRILLLEIADSQELAALDPDFSALYGSHNSINGVLVTAASGTDGYDFHSRYFWPWSGTNEDPVTGGTHTFLAKYWSPRLGKAKMKSFQSSKRTGFMEVELIDGKLRIKGQAVIVLEGQLTIQLQFELRRLSKSSLPMLRDKGLPPYLYGDVKREEGKSSGKALDLIKQWFDTYEQWEVEFKKTANALGGGSGWTIVSYNQHTREVHNYWAWDHMHKAPIGYPLLVLDMYEHAYQMDYGAAVA